MAPAVPPKNNAVALTSKARIPENDVPSSSVQSRNFNGSSSYHDMFPQSSSRGTRSSTVPSSERRKMIEDLIKEGPQGGPNREKMLRTAQQLRSPSSSSSSSSRRTNHMPSSRIATNHVSTEEDDNDIQTNDINNDNNNTNDMNSSSMGGGGPYRNGGMNSGMGMGGGGMGMGGYGGGGMYGGMGSMYGMGMGMGMSPMMMGGGMMSGPMSWVYSLQAIVHSIGYAINVVGMNSHMLYHLFNQLWGMVIHSMELIKKSTFRKW